MVDAGDLKSPELCSCRFESGRPHHRRDGENQKSSGSRRVIATFGASLVAPISKFQFIVCFSLSRYDMPRTRAPTWSRLDFCKVQSGTFTVMGT